MLLHVSLLPVPVLITYYANLPCGLACADRLQSILGLQSEHAVTSSETMKDLTVPGEYSTTCHIESKRLPYIAQIAASDYKCKPTVRNSKERQHFGFVYVWLTSQPGNCKVTKPA